MYDESFFEAAGSVMPEDSKTPLNIILGLLVFAILPFLTFSATWQYTLPVVLFTICTGYGIVKKAPEKWRPWRYLILLGAWLAYSFFFCVVTM